MQFAAGWLLLLAATTAWANPPEVSYIHPDYPTAGPRVITGEGFPTVGSHLEVLCWRPPESKEEVEAGLQAWAQGQPPSWPSKPPEDAVHAPVLDSEARIAVAALSGVVMWVRTREGVSRPYAFDLAMPWWLLEDEVRPGDIAVLGGRGMRALYRQDSVALLAAGKALRLTALQPRRDYRTMDDNVIFLPLPPDLAPGRYRVVVHNGNGGRFGWRDGGWLTVLAKDAKKPRRFDVRDFGRKAKRNPTRMRSPSARNGRERRRIRLLPAGPLAHRTNSRSARRRHASRRGPRSLGHRRRGRAAQSSDRPRCWCIPATASRWSGSRSKARCIAGRAPTGKA